jgi:hypothetical protein
VSDAAGTEGAGTSGLDGLARQVGEGVSDLVQQEVATAKADLTASAKEGVAGMGLLGGAALSGLMALLFGSIAVWRGLGTRIGYGKSAALVAAFYGTSAIVLSAKGGEELSQMTGSQRFIEPMRRFFSTATR